MEGERTGERKGIRRKEEGRKGKEREEDEGRRTDVSDIGSSSWEKTACQVRCDKEYSHLINLLYYNHVHFT
jgi:hypothetical protein